MCICLFTREASMFVDVTMPWFLKGAILMYDIALYILTPNNVVHDTIDMYVIMFNIFMLTSLASMALILPSTFVGVADRRRTNRFLMEMMTLFGMQGLLIMSVQHGRTECAFICLCLQFSLAYSVYCIWLASTAHPRLLVGNYFVQACTLLCIVLVPVIFSHALNKGMHLSPNVFAISFAGECLGMAATLFVEAFERIGMLIPTI